MRSYCLALPLALLSAISVAQEPRQVLFLRAETRQLPLDDTAIKGRLARELGRQALLLAAREDFGMLTRDERLGEVVSVAATDLVALDVTARVQTSWLDPPNLMLRGEDLPLSARLPVEPTVDQLTIPTLYSQLTIAWEEASRNGLAELLVQAGATPRETVVTPDNKPPGDVEALLNKMDWFSQYAAVRAAHESIFNDGVSVEWMAVLARGYAHLGTLVEHHWTGTPEVFFARSLLYAERARLIDADHTEAKLLRPYCLALASAHANALTELEAIDASEDSLPDWAKLIEPACEFDLERLRQVGDDAVELRPISRWLILCLRRTFGGHRLLHDFAMDALEESPAAYGAYSNLVTYYPSRLSQQIGAYRGPAALGAFLPDHFLELYARGDENDTTRDLEVDFEKREQPPTEKALELPYLIACQLRRESRLGESTPEPSWGLLASLIEEEIFVMAANYCKALTNRTESSLAEEVDAVLPFVETHPYEPYVRLYRYPRSEQPAERARLFSALRIAEPRHNMREMFLEVARLPTDEASGGINVGKAASWRAYRSADFRLSSLAEEIIGGHSWWWGRLNADQQRKVFADYRMVSPHSLHWLRGLLSQANNPSPEQLAEWEPLAIKDCSACEWIGHHYSQAGKPRKAIEWYQRAYDLVPNRGTAWRLAEVYRAQGDRDRWLQTLDDCLENVEPRGLEHVALRIDIARALMQDRDFQSAIPYAEEAAEAHSAAGLSVAMAANEGAGDLERADEYARQASVSYESKWGDQWYLFRKRNRYGDPTEARPYLEKTLQAGRGRRWLKIFLPVLDGDLETAYTRFHAEGIRTRELYWYMMSSLLVAEIGDSDRLRAELETLRSLNSIYMKEANPPFYAMVSACADLLEAPESTEIDPSYLDAQLAGMAPGYRRDYEFFLGATLQVIDREPDLSEKMLRRASGAPAFDDMGGTLAGYYLGRKHSEVRKRSKPETSPTP